MMALVDAPHMHTFIHIHTYIRTCIMYVRTSTYGWMDALHKYVTPAVVVKHFREDAHSGRRREGKGLVRVRWRCKVPLQDYL